MSKEFKYSGETSLLTIFNLIKGKLTSKVDKVDGKSLSSNDFTDSHKSKLEGLSNYTHPSHAAADNGLYKVTVDNKGHVSGTTKVTKSDITALGIPGANTDTTYSVATETEDGLLCCEDKVKLDSVEQGANKTVVDSSLSASSTNPIQNKVVNTALAGKAPATHVSDTTAHVTSTERTNWNAAKTTAETAKSTADGSIKSLSASGKVITYTKNDGTTGTITTQDTTYSLPAAGSSLGGVKSGGDVTISDGVITVNDDSHNHTIANVDGLQDALNAKVPTTRTINGKPLSDDISLTASDVAGTNSESISTGSTAMGVNVTAGSNAFYIEAINGTTKKIYLRTTNDIPTTRATINTAGTVVRNFNETDGYSVGDEFSIIRNTHYAFCGTITGINGNEITYDNYVMVGDLITDSDGVNKPGTKTTTSNTFATATTTDSRELWEDCIFWVPKKPQVGFRIWNHDENNPEEVFQGAHVFGNTNWGSADSVFVSGKENAAGGNGAQIFGTRNRGAYGNFITGGDNFSNGLHSVVTGRYNVNKGNYNALFNTRNETTGEGNLIGGDRNKSTSHYNLIGGQENEVSGRSSLVIGRKNNSSGFDNIIGGYGNTSNGNQNLIAGDTISSNGSCNIAGGKSQIITGSYNESAGIYQNITGDYNTVSGYNQDIDGNYNVAMGANNTVSGEFHTVSGHQNSVKGGYNFVIAGKTSSGVSGNDVTGYANAVLGASNYLNTNHNFVAGINNHAAISYCTLLGRDLKSTLANDQFIAGRANAEDSGAAFIFGFGTSDSDRKNCLTAGKYGTRSTVPTDAVTVQYLKDNYTTKTAIASKADLINGKVPSSQLPSYVDDTIEGYLYNSKWYKESSHTTQITGETGKIYVDLSTNKTYRWSGSAFVEISASLALGETSSTAYRGDRGKVAYDHAVSAHNYSPSGHTHTVTHKPAGSNANTSITPAGTVKSTFTGTAASHSHGFTGTEATISASYTPAGTVSSTFTGTAHNHGFTGTAVNSGKPDTTNVTTIYSITGVGSLPSLTFSEGTLPSATFSAGELPSLTFSAGTLPSASLSKGTLPSASHTASSLSASVKDQCLTLSFTPDTHSFSAGTLPSLTFSAGSLPSVTFDDGSLPSLSFSAGTLPSATFSAGSLPTRSSAISMPNVNHTHSVTASGTIGNKTAGGSVSSSFTGTEATISTKYTPAGSVNSKSVTPAGTIESTFTGTAAEHTHTFTGTSATLTTSAG